MSDIPEGIRNSAFAIADEWAPNDGLRDALQTAIAEALKAERERCAKIADKVRHRSEMGDFGQGQDEASQSIAEDIRMGRT